MLRLLILAFLVASAAGGSGFSDTIVTFRAGKRCGFLDSAFRRDVLSGLRLRGGMADAAGQDDIIAQLNDTALEALYSGEMHEIPLIVPAEVPIPRV